MVGDHKLSNSFWWWMIAASRTQKMARETAAILNALKQRGMTQKQCAVLVGGPAALYRFREIARGKRLPDQWELQRLRAIERGDVP